MFAVMQEDFFAGFAIVYTRGAEVNMLGTLRNPILAKRIVDLLNRNGMEDVELTEIDVEL